MNAISTFSRLHLAATLVIGLSLFSTGGHATPVVDQHNLGPIQGNVAYDHNLSRGQSFTVGIEGLLAGVEFHFNKSRSRATGNAYVSMYSTDGGGAPDNLLGQVSLPAASISTTHALVYFDLTPLAIGVTVGELMFATLHADFSGGMYATQNTYADGSEWGCGPSYGIVCWTAADNGIPDLVFRSHVVPIPASGSVTLFALGFAGLGLPRRRRLKSSTRI